MSSLADAVTRRSTIARINALRPDAKPKWGKMDAPQMMTHCADALRMAYGDLACTPANVPIARLGVVKWLIFNVVPFPKGARTAKELTSRVPTEFGAERSTCIALVERFEKEKARVAWPAHPLFGPMNGKEWGVLAAKHLDHHLTQFGV